MTEFHAVVTHDAHSINRWSCEVSFKNEQDAQKWWKFNTNKKRYKSVDKVVIVMYHNDEAVDFWRSYKNPEIIPATI